MSAGSIVHSCEMLLCGLF